MSESRRAFFVTVAAASLASALLGCPSRSEEQGAAPPEAAAEPPPTNPPDGFVRATGTRRWSFPRDHAAHPDYATEWWYTTGILRGEDGRTYGYELTFFRSGLRPPGEVAAGRSAPAGSAVERRDSTAAQPGDSGPAAPDSLSPWRASDLLLAHAAISDVAGRRFLVEQRLDRAALGWAGADTLAMRVWVDGWRAEWDGSGFRLSLPAETTAGDLGLDLRLVSTRPPVLHGRDGLSLKDASAEPHASWYVSLPRLETSGRITVEGRSVPVTGTTWMDHEFFSGTLASRQVGWDWFSCRLADGRDLMLFRLRTRAGTTDYAAGTFTSTDGETWRSADVSGATFEPLERWTSPASAARYPAAWRIRLPAEELELTSRTPLLQQEVVAAGDAGFTYWEGLVDYDGTWRGARVRGEGYVEMTGYDRPIRLR